MCNTSIFLGVMSILLIGTNALTLYELYKADKEIFDLKRRVSNYILALIETYTVINENK